MFILDSLMISGIRWALETALTAAEAEMNDDSVLREQLLEAEMRRETGEISDEEFREIEADLLVRIRAIKERREGGAGPLAVGGGRALEHGEDARFQIEASVSGDFHDPAVAPHTTIVAPLEGRAALGLVETTGGETIEVLDMEPGDAAPPAEGAPERRPASRRAVTSAARRPRAAGSRKEMSSRASAASRTRRSTSGGSTQPRAVRPSRSPRRDS